MVTPKVYRPLRYLGIALVILAGLFLAQRCLLGGPFRYIRVCQHCGAFEYATDWSFPFTDWVIYTESKISPTPFSRMLENMGLAHKGAHDWLFIHGGGNGVRCAIGDGDRVWSSVESTNLVYIIETAHKYGELQFRDKVIHTALDPEAAYAARWLGFDVPEKKFGSAEEFRAWIANATPDFDLFIAEYKKH